MDEKLNEILNHNPFSKELVGKWRTKLSEIANVKDFGGDKTQEEFFGNGYPYAHFVLEGDKKYINDARFYTHYIPQPFIGHPSAPIWILNENPSPFGSDVCAMLNVSDSARQLKWVNGAGQEPAAPNYVEANLHALGVRQELMLKQLRLVEDVSFFPLDPRFDIVRREGRALRSMFLWWRSFICGSERNRMVFPFHTENVTEEYAKQMAKKVFVLEAFPYRSVHFHDVEDLQSGKYHKFWKELVRYALEHKKFIIGRGARLIRAIRADEKLSKADVRHFNNWRHPTLSLGNVDGLAEVVGSLWGCPPSV